jgi:two-component system response regulator AtoC
VRAIGSEQARKINVRIIAATNKNLDKMVQDGSFREDLYFRLNVFQIPLPSLQQRKEDLPELIRHFIQKESTKMGISTAIEVRPAAMQSLLTYNWPGNVRELQNVLARSLILSENGVIEVSDLPQNIRPSEYLSEPQSSGCQDSLKRQLRNYEQAIIKTAIDEANGDRKVAADRLGIGVSSLYRKLDTSIEI